MICDEHLNCSHDPTIIKIQELDNIIEQYSQQQRELRRQRDLKSNKDRKDEFKQAIDKITKLMRPIREERVILKKKKYKHTMCEKRRFRWLKKPMGVLPTILKNLLDARSKTKKEMKAV
jgi:DNA polymerase elongation subunit (family B)